MTSAVTIAFVLRLSGRKYTEKHPSSLNLSCDLYDVIGQIAADTFTGPRKYLHRATKISSSSHEGTCMKMEAIIAPFPVMVVHGTGSQNLTAKEAFTGSSAH